MEFSDIILTKDSSLLLHVICILKYLRILKKTLLFSGFNNPYKRIRETRKLESIHRKLDKNTSLRNLDTMLRNLD
jgi:hypothetical protein